jgi:ribA/ribD-fused uncharacterized protein
VINYFGTGIDAGGNSFLSNFYVHDGWTVEHQFQAAKTDDPRWVRAILHSATPGQAKKLGRQAPIRATWEQEKIAVMLTLLRVKFSIPDLARRLVETGDEDLVEGNTWGDTFWGVCNGVGENWLGRLLMQVREELTVTW